MAPRSGSFSSLSSQYSARTFTSYNSTSSHSTSVTVPDTYMTPFAAGNLPCEFVGYANCDRTFALDDVDSWIEHIVTQHLHNNLPRKVICWFCDDVVFDCKTVGDRRVNFDHRMWHIRSHILEEGLTAHNMRPDHHLNTHLDKHRLVPEQAYNTVRKYTEFPQGPWILAHDDIPEELGNRNSRGDYVYNDPKGEERKERKRHKHEKSRK